MFVPSAKSNISLVGLLLVSILLFIWVENSRIFISDKNYDEKLAASELMQKAEKTTGCGNNIFCGSFNVWSYRS